MPINRIDRIRPDAPELAAFGPYPVGVCTQTHLHRDQIDVLNVRGGYIPRYDRPLTFEIWYPAAPDTQPGTTYDTILRDGVTPTCLSGRAARDATPAQGKFPLVILSHGYPGNRFLMSHLGENLASKGYVVVSIDHTDSTYADKAALSSTLVNRPLDQRFAIDAMAAQANPLAGMIDGGSVAIIGYSMGSYGALVFGGAGVSQVAVDMPEGAPAGLLGRYLAGSADHKALIDNRVKAIVPIGPWGGQREIWEDAGLAGLCKPALIVAGSIDDVSGYDGGIRRIFTGATGTDRQLLTFHNAGHNAAAPIPAPEESWKPSPALEFVPFEHYADPVWDTVRMNNIAQHFITAFLGLHLKDQENMAEYLSGSLPLRGFASGADIGLRLETSAR